MILFVRGDLRSESGWARATRALVAAVRNRFDHVLGADLHFHPLRASAPPPFPVVDDHGTRTLLSQLNGVVVLHACQPDNIQRVRGALNVGWWFWETDRIDLDRDWLERLEALDLLLLPSEWQAEWVLGLGLDVPLAVIPWPHRLPSGEPAPDAMVRAVRPFSRDALAALAALEADATAAAAAERDRRLEAQEEPFAVGPGAPVPYAFAVQSDAPRKGLACLLAEWRRYREAGGELRRLLIRFSGLNVAHDACRLLQSLSRIGIAAMRGADGMLEEVRAVLTPLPDATLRAAYAGARCFVVPSFGEGFGGTIVEAVDGGTLPVAPRHTACGQLIPSDYPLVYASEPFVGALMDQLPIQPANGSWHLPAPGAIAAAMRRLDAMDDAARASAHRALAGHLGATLAPERVAERFAAALGSLGGAR